jgi:hypothetical protein
MILMMMMTDDENDEIRHSGTCLSWVNILMFLLSPTVSTLNHFGGAAGRPDEGIRYVS